VEFFGRVPEIVPVLFPERIVEVVVGLEVALDLRVIAFSALNGPPGTKRCMKNVTVTITSMTGMVSSRRGRLKRT